MDALSWTLPKSFWSPPVNFAFTVLEENINFCGKKVPKTLLRTKNEKTYFGRVLLEEQKRKKNIVSGKRYQIAFLHSYFALLRRLPKCFCPKIDKKCLRSKIKKDEPRENKNAVFHILIALLKTPLKTFLLRPRTLQRTVREKTYISAEKNTKMTSAHKKWRMQTLFRKFRSQYESFPLEVLD